MNFFKKIDIRNIIAVVFFIAILIIPFLAFAQMPGDSSISTGGSSVNPLDKVSGIAGGSGYDTSASASSLSDIISNVINAFLAILGVIFLILIIYAGYLWMTAQGNDEQVKKAKDLIRNAIIGVIIIVAAYAITAFVFSYLIG